MPDLKILIILKFLVQRLAKLLEFLKDFIMFEFLSRLPYDVYLTYSK